MDKKKSIVKPDFRDKDLFVRLFGKDVYAVGGYVRDLYRDIHDSEVDLLITNHPVEDIVKKLQDKGKVDLVGKSFGVIKFTVNKKTYDIALPRKDIAQEKKTRGHKDFIIEADPFLPVEKDLERRDFRCNSVAIRLEPHTIIDPLDGQTDIQEKILRLTNPNAFPDDPLRVLRAARFASNLEYQIGKEIYSLSKNIDLSGLSMERINEEIFKILLDSPVPSLGLEELFQLGALRQIIPELYRLTLSIQDSVFHPEKDDYGHHTVWKHTKITVDQAKRIGESHLQNRQENLALLLAALYHDIGKPNTAHWEFKKGRMVITNNKHDITSEKITENIFIRLKIHSWNGYDLRKTVLDLIRCHHRASELWQNRSVITKKAFNRLAADVEGEIELLIYLDAADRAGRDETPAKQLDEQSTWLLNKFKEMNVTKESIKPLIMGRDLIKLGIEPGPDMGKILKKLYEMQLDNQFEDRESGFKAAGAVVKGEKS